MNSSKSLKLNVSFNFIGLAYITVIGIVVLPLYLQYLGAEAFGLVGFFAVLQSWMLLLGVGMSPLLSRQAAHSRGQNDDCLELRKLVRSLELIVFVLAIIVVLCIAASSMWIANSWLNAEILGTSEVSTCIVLMGAMIGLKLFSSLYLSGIQGLENQVWLNVANIILVTLKYLGALFLLAYFTADIVDFFVYQVFVGFIELMSLAIMFYYFIPSKNKVGVKFFWGTLKPMLPFAGGIAYTAGIWVLITQLDKLVLTNILSLSEYGYFSLVVVVATGISQVSSPISQAILPRMTSLLSQGKEQGMLELYRKSTQLMSVIIFPLTGVVALFSTELLFAWTGDRKAAEWAGPILFWFALGNGILTISAFQYYLQFAHGKLRMHVIYSSISASIQIPIIIYVAFNYGAMGVALVWFSIRLVSFIIWPPIVHKKFAPGIHWSWLMKDVAPIFVVTSIALLVLMSMNIAFEDMGRMSTFMVLIGAGVMVLLCNLLVSSAFRSLLYENITRYIYK